MVGKTRERQKNMMKKYKAGTLVRGEDEEDSGIGGVL